MIRALLQFCDPSRMVSKFSNFELVPKIEEINGFIELSYHSVRLLYPGHSIKSRSEVQSNIYLLQSWGVILSTFCIHASAMKIVIFLFITI